jgi:hypothetical protein
MHGEIHGENVWSEKNERTGQGGHDRHIEW